MKCPKCGYEGNKPHQKRCLICDAPLIPGQPTQEEAPTEETAETSASPLVEADPVPTHNIEETTESVLTEAPRPPVGNFARQIPQHLECPRCHSQVPLNVKFCPQCGCNMLQPKDTESPIEVEQPRPERPRPLEHVRRERPRSQVEESSNIPEEDVTLTATQAKSDEIHSQYTPEDVLDDPNHGYSGAAIDYEDINPQGQQSSSSHTVLLVIVAAIVSIILGIIANRIFD